MSFRYTNSLIGVLKHRMLLECSYREIATRTFIGYCRGVEVVCSGYGSVLKVRLTEKEMWEPFYRNSAVYSNSEPLADKAEGESETASPMTGAASTGPLDLERLSESVRAALWDATRKIRSAKEAALHRSLSHNPQLQATAELKHWYEEDANTLRPLAFEALKHEAATPWMRLIQFGKLKEAASLLKNQRQGGASSSSQGVVNNGEKQQLQSTEGADVHAPLKDTLTVADLHPSTIPIGSVHPLFTPALIQMEDSQTGAVNDDAVRRAQLWELSRDEQYFWERVELIRKGQIASIGSVHKRGYADEALSAKDNAEEKVQLRFTQ
ncbi:unnamed protein product [Trypanosoma congolense IL3000]|uniref:WGS project CAEQ00000000 data, annotated contig 661 n=1 Tax=Trypanosoma congolense (strain IL3000) TaxID=1068625 RepID=F9WHK4_TRYCI|nr:unnamed protein product [Trypanosoma congolense IL3000]